MTNHAAIMIRTGVSRVRFMRRELHELGESPIARSPRRYAVSLELMACIALVVSTIVAATVVSIGIARADMAATPDPGKIASSWSGLPAN